MNFDVSGNSGKLRVDFGTGSNEVARGNHSHTTGGTFIGHTDTPSSYKIESQTATVVMTRNTGLLGKYDILSGNRTLPTSMVSSGNARLMANYSFGYNLEETILRIFLESGNSLNKTVVENTTVNITFGSTTYNNISFLSSDISTYYAGLDLTSTQRIAIANNTQELTMVFNVPEILLSGWIPVVNSTGTGLVFVENKGATDPSINTHITSGLSGSEGEIRIQAGTGVYGSINIGSIFDTGLYYDSNYTRSSTDDEMLVRDGFCLESCRS